MIEEGDACTVEPRDPVDDRFEERRVDARAGLVEQDQARLGDEHAGEFQELALASGKHARGLIGEMRQTDEVDPMPRGARRASLLDPRRAEA